MIQCTTWDAPTYTHSKLLLLVAVPPTFFLSCDQHSWGARGDDSKCPHFISTSSPQSFSASLDHFSSDWFFRSLQTSSQPHITLIFLHVPVWDQIGNSTSLANPLNHKWWQCSLSFYHLRAFWMITAIDHSYQIEIKVAIGHYKIRRVEVEQPNHSIIR